jgi:cytochrome c oxidase subunit 1
MGSAAIFGMMSGIYHWYPKMFGRLMNRTMGYFHFWLTFISAYVVFFPMHFMGLAGVPRRYYQFTLIPEFGIWMDVNVLITCGAILGGLAQLLFLVNFFRSIWYGEKTVQNPWKSNTLEWTPPIKHIHGNWPGAIPAVYRGPHEYSRPDREEDYYPQHIPPADGEEEFHHAPLATHPTEEPVHTESPTKVFFSSFVRLFEPKRA